MHFVFQVPLTLGQVSKDTYDLESVDGFIHLLKIDDEGNQVAVAYATTQGMLIKILTMDTFRKNNETTLLD